MWPSVNLGPLIICPKVWLLPRTLRLNEYRTTGQPITRHKPRRTELREPYSEYLMNNAAPQAYPAGLRKCSQAVFRMKKLLLLISVLIGGLLVVAMGFRRRSIHVPLKSG